jgi:hypothetical protein
MGVNNVHTKNGHQQCAITVAFKRDYRTVHAYLRTGGARFTSGSLAKGVANVAVAKTKAVSKRMNIFLCMIITGEEDKDGSWLRNCEIYQC